MAIQDFDTKFELKYTIDYYLLAGILFLALLFVVIDLWSFEESRDFAKKRLSPYIYISDKSHSWLANSSPLEVTRVPL